MKGVIAGINPSARVIDITHSVPSYNIAAGGFILCAAYKYFPEKTIFLAIVDPGVGTNRRIILAETTKYFFIAPDNGLLTAVLEEDEVVQVREIVNKEYFLPEISGTFEGRDKMAPAAAWLSLSVSCENFGPKLDSYIKEEVKKSTIENNVIYGNIVYSDKFGNLITNIPEKMPELLKKGTKEEVLELYLKNSKISSYVKSYNFVNKGENLFLPGSLGFIEIAVREGSAAETLGAEPGDQVIVKVSSLAD
jgi:S-adenosylmethionine hydrolase